MYSRRRSYTYVYFRTTILQEMNNDDNVDTDEHNCGLDYIAVDNLISKTTKKRSVKTFTP